MIQRVPLIFARSNQVGSLAIRLFTWSRWSHVGIIDGDAVIEAVGFKGVVVTPLEEFKQRYSTYEIAYAPVEDIDRCYYRAYQQVGKKYDWSAIFGHIFRRRWDDTEAWVCSELYAHSSEMVRYDRVSSFTPEDCYKISRSNP